MSDLRIRRGDTTTINVAAKKPDGSPQPLTGFTVRFTAKDRHSDLDAAAVISKSSPSSGVIITDGPNGLATVTISPSDTAGFTRERVLVWDVQYGDGVNAKTLDDGLLYVLPDVTRTV